MGPVTPWGGLWTVWWAAAVLLLASLLAMSNRRPDVADLGAAGVLVFGIGWLCLTLIVLVPR